MIGVWKWLVATLVGPLLGGLIGALTALGLTLPGAQCVDLLARELLGLKPSDSNSSLPPLPHRALRERWEWRVDPAPNPPGSEHLKD